MKINSTETSIAHKVGKLEEIAEMHSEEIKTLKTCVEDNTRAVNKLSDTIDSMAPTMMAIQDLVKGASVFQKIIIWVAAALASIATITQVFK